MIVDSATKKQTSFDPNEKQFAASDPLSPVWVGASAGTGKTRVLTNRVLRLLLPRNGGDVATATKPHKILCLTFTKTAAAEMASRLYEALSSWAVMESAELRSELAKIGVEANDVTEEAARKLFAQVLDSPGGLKIMTIHSFCQSVLRRFPVEAKLSPNFELMDEAAAVEYLNKCLRDIIRETKLKPHSAKAKAFNSLVLYLDSEMMADTMQQIISKRSQLSRIIHYHGDNLVPRIYAELGVEYGWTAQSIIENLRKDTDRKKFLTIIEVMQKKGTDKDVVKAGEIARWLEKGDNFASYRKVFVTNENTVSKRLTTKDVRIAMSDAEEVMIEEAHRIMEADANLVSLRQAELNGALMNIAASMLERYEEYKSSSDKLDYDDLIIRTAQLLNSSDMVPWVLYKLDSGIDHILVDEAQDTSGSQWQIVKALTEEFFEKHGSRDDLTRTLFVVGDEKQSIFGFQGAEPKKFDEMHKFWNEKIKAIELEYSFRSTAAVLDTVDSVFANPVAKNGVIADVNKDIRHIVFREGEAGVVELWPIITPDEKEESANWRLPSEIIKGSDTAGQMAERIAETIEGWLKAEEKLVSKNRPIRAGDIMILVQSRNEFVKALMRNLKSRNVPVAGFDRMKLLDEIAILDLLALAKFALLPKDDLNLASLLKSPLIGMSEDDLYGVCFGRNGKLWLSLRQKHQNIAEYLQYWLENAERLTPYEFFSAALTKSCANGAMSGRKAFYSRLGYDIEDSFDEFLNSCLQYEQDNSPSLQNFVDWFMRSAAEIKRDQEAGGQDMVRIMTVHASKGLQAPIVFLPDANRKAYEHNRAKPRIIWPENGDGVVLWAPRDEFESDLYKELQAREAQKQGEEYRRLLYVAMTRAEDRLYIGGFRGVRAEKEDCWHSLIRAGFPSQKIELPCEFSDENIWRYECAQTKSVKQTTEEQAEVFTFGNSVPEWALSPTGEEPKPPKPLAPSKMDDDEAVNSPLFEGAEWKFNRGNIVHKLLELLPQLPFNERGEAMANYLARAAFAIPDKEQVKLCVEITRILNHQDFSPIFAEGSKAEVAVTGIVGDNVVSGKIDRLVVNANHVLIVDYKSNRNPPENTDEIPVIYLKQLGAYISLIRKIYPDKEIKAALLWTETPLMMVVDNNKLDPYVI